MYLHTHKTKEKDKNQILPFSLFFSLAEKQVNKGVQNMPMLFLLTLEEAFTVL